MPTLTDVPTPPSWELVGKPKLKVPSGCVDHAHSMGTTVGLS